MGDFTSRLGLYLSGGGSANAHGADETADIDKVNDNFKIIDGLPTGIIGATKAALPNGWFIGQLAFVSGDGIAYRWGNFSGTPQWRAWESDWIDFTSGVSFPGSGIQFTTTASRYRYGRGRVLFLFSGTMATFNGSYTQLGLPVPREAAGGLANSACYAVHAGVRYLFLADFAAVQVANFYFNFGTNNGAASAMTGASPVGWSAGDTFAVEMEYDPA